MQTLYDLLNEKDEKVKKFTKKKKEERRAHKKLDKQMTSTVVSPGRSVTWPISLFLPYKKNKKKYYIILFFICKIYAFIF